MKLNSSTEKIFFWFFYSFLLMFFSVPSVYSQANSEPAFHLKIQSNNLTAEVKEVLINRVNNFDRVSIEGLINSGDPAEPSLPVKTVKFLVPYGKKVTGINVNWTDKKVLEGSYRVEPVPMPIPLSYQGSITPTMPDPKIYSSYDDYPGKLYSQVSTQFIRGYQVAIINLYPVSYVPATGEISYYENMNLSIELEDVAGAKPHELFRGLPSDMAKVEKFVDNSEEGKTYSGVQPAIKPLHSVQYVIITSDALKNATGTYTFQDLIAQKQAQGLTAEIITTEWIYANYSGIRPDGASDNATRVRNFISDYYSNHSAEYVLLGGDGDASGLASGETQATPVVPARGFYADVDGTSGDNNIPADLYYACLDGTFDSDEDGIYAEATDGTGGTDIDLVADVFVGRAPVDSSTEVSNFVKKTIAYENSTDSYRTNVCMVSEQLDSLTYGKPYMLEIQNGSSANGYTTVGMNGSGFFNFSSLYEQDWAWTTNNLINKMNSNIHILNHLGHANNTVFSKTFSTTDADALTNTKYFLCFTQGCYSGAFDNRTTATSTYETLDSVLEHLVVASAGAFACIGNSRYGWYASGSTDGPSQRFHREFWDGVVSEGKLNLGKALQDAKEDHVGVINDTANRWCYYTLNLLGDPQTQINASLLSPTDFSASPIAFSNASWVVTRWKNSSRATVQSTMVRYRTDGVYPASETDGALLCTRPASVGAVDTFNHTNIEANTTYHYVAFGYDGSNYEGSSAVNNRATVAIGGIAGSENTGRSDCFVATVCFGSRDDLCVKILRKFRDRYLIKRPFGRQFVAVYYLIGPYFANIIKNDNQLKCVVRYLLRTVVSMGDCLTQGVYR
ncbi:MAG: hypothetical protein HY810_03015 [Candidatus Omnitrophica bacterium]|nr:hypothetical protein [Candidatus Omnitrophota bacterium]